jgi:hypothetical protein
MPLTPGARLGAHEIPAPLGAGGMGEVSVPVSNAGGRLPMWGADSRTLYFVEGTNVRSATITAAGRVDAPKAVVDLPPSVDTLDIAPDGRFLLVRPTGQRTDSIEVVLNWSTHRE